MIDFFQVVETNIDVTMPLLFLDEKTYIQVHVKFIPCRFATKRMLQRERLEQLGDQPKKFTNVYVKNFGDEMTEAAFRELVDPFGKVFLDLFHLRHRKKLNR